MIVVKTKFTEKDLGFSSFGLNQGRLAMSFCEHLTRAFEDRGLVVSPTERRVGMKFRIQVDIPLVQVGQSFNTATGFLYLNPAFDMSCAEKLEFAINRWGALSVSNWRDVQVKPMPKTIQDDLKICPFLLDCLGAQVLALRLENLAERIADSLAPVLEWSRVPIARVPPSKHEAKQKPRS